MIQIKTASEIDAMRAAGKAVAYALLSMKKAVEAGERKTLELDRIAADTLKSVGAKSAFLGYKPAFSDLEYKYNACISINNEVIHGLPGEQKVLQEGDIVGLDLGASVDGWFGDAAITIPVGKADHAALNLILATEKALLEGIKKAKPGNYTGDIGFVIQEVARTRRYRIVESFTGHGIGRNIHEEPDIRNVGMKGMGELLVPGMTFCIEPMFTIGSGEVRLDEDGWTIRTVDNSLSSHSEHTVAVLASGPEILTTLPVEVIG